MMIAESVYGRLRTGFFAERSDDVGKARELIAGRLRLGDTVLDVFAPSTFEEIGALPRNHVVQLHSLRWADVLRRVGSEVPGAMDAWARIFDAWSRSEPAANRKSVAWGTGPLEQRAVALVLGAPEGSEAEIAMTAHLEAMEAVKVSTLTSDRRLRHLDVCLGLRARRGDPGEALQSTAMATAATVFTDDGYTVAKDLEGIVAASDEWARCLRDLGVPRDDAVFARLRGADFWLHDMAPDGSLVPMGAAVPTRVPGATDPRMQYVVTGGAGGSSPEEIRHVDPMGLVSFRSGWGETEKDARDETLVTMVLGPVRGRDAHADVARVTYYSQGRPWLVDPIAPVASGVATHSVVAVDGTPYRHMGKAELVRQYSDDQVEGVVTRNTVHVGAQWHRHMVFARTGNYMVVEDRLRSSQEHVAHQQWIVAPDVEIESTRQGFLLHSDEKSVALIVSSSGLKDHVIDALRDDDGSRIAWRIRVPMVGSSSRAVAMIADVVDPQAFRARRVAHPGREFAIAICDKQLDEMLVVTPEVAGVVPRHVEASVAVAHIVQRGAGGDLSEERQLGQRIAVRRAIQEVKSTIREECATPAARRRGIRSLLQAGEDLKVRGLRDHGYAAALIDIAGTDLAYMLSGDAQVGNMRRSPLVDWPHQALEQPGYGVRVRTTLEASTFPEGLTEPAVWSVDLGQLVLSSYLHDAPGDVLTVYFHGATDRTRYTVPRYERLRSLPGLGLGPVMSFSDPCLDLDSRMILSWFVGTEEIDVHQQIAHMVEAYARHKGIDKVLLVGNSGGGFAALQVGAVLEGTRVVSFNPQIRTDDYVPRLSKAAHWALFGRETVADDPANAPRMDIIERYRRIDFAQDVVLIQNPGDDHHYQRHFLPFVSAYGESENAERLVTHAPDLGPGHRVPAVDEYLKYVVDAAESERQEFWQLAGLREEK